MRRRDAMRAVAGLVATGPVLPRAFGAERPEATSPLEAEVSAYHDCVAGLRRLHSVSRALPEAPFFLFSAGPRRPKLVYRSGVLREDGGAVVRRWDIEGETVVPSAYAVSCVSEVAARSGSPRTRRACGWRKAARGRRSPAARCAFPHSTATRGDRSCGPCTTRSSST